MRSSPQPSRRRKAGRTVAFLGVAALALLLPNVFGVVLLSWFEPLFDPARLTREDVDRETALACSAGQQLIRTAWSVGLAVVLVAVVFGWAGGKQLLAASYGEAKARAPKVTPHRRRRAEK